jgi:hypothetical protein
MINFLKEEKLVKLKELERIAQEAVKDEQQGVAKELIKLKEIVKRRGKKKSEELIK